MKQIAITVSRFNEMITDSLLQGALQTLKDNGVDVDERNIVKVPGAFELPLAAQVLAETEQFDAIICLGAVIRGETPHFDYICQAVANGITDVGLNFELPVIFGVLTTDTLEQAQDRSCNPVGNKGVDAAECALEMIDLLAGIRKAGA